MLELRIFGPGLDVVQVLRAGQPELVLGRDADCGICLPDPERNVSRRHLAVASVLEVRRIGAHDLAAHLARRLVLSQPLECRLSHIAIAGPSGEFDLGD